MCETGRRNTHGLLDISVAEASGEHRLAGERLGDRDDVGAVDHLSRVRAEDDHLCERSRERRGHVREVVCEPQVSSPSPIYLWR